MEPRIVVPDPADFDLVVEALVHQAHRTWASCSMVGGLVETVETGRRICDLLSALIDQAQGDAVQREFGPVTDEILRDGITKIREEFGE